jgi:hypothetical protein
VGKGELTGGFSNNFIFGHCEERRFCEKERKEK